MAIKLPDGRIMRTLPEQVDKNMQDIASINNEVNVIKESITTAYKIQGSATVADLNANTPDAAMNGYVYNMTDAGYLTNSDASTTSVQIGDNVVLVWNDGNFFWDCLSGVVDTSNLVTLDSEQDITGNKTFKSSQAIFKYDDHVPFYSFYMADYDALICKRETVTQFEMGNNSIFLKSVYPLENASYDLGMSSLKFKDFYLSNRIYLGSSGTSYINTDAYNGIGFQINNNTKFLIREATTYVNNNLCPLTDNQRDLGASGGALFRNLYLGGNISDGTNSVTVAEIIKKRLTVSYNVSAAASTGISMVNLTLSAADLAKLDSTKPLIVANNSTSAAVISAVYLPALNLFTVLAYQTQGNTSLDFDIYQ